MAKGGGEFIIDEYLEMLESLIKREKLYINDLLYQTAIFVTFINKGFNDQVDRKQKGIFGENFLLHYNERIARHNRVLSVIEKRMEKSSIVGVNPKAIEELKNVIEQQFGQLQNNLRLYCAESAKKAAKLTAHIKKFC